MRVRGVRGRIGSKKDALQLVQDAKKVEGKLQEGSVGAKSEFRWKGSGMRVDLSLDCSQP